MKIHHSIPEIPKNKLSNFSPIDANIGEVQLSR